MIAYFDTSALMKLLVNEPASEVAAILWDEASIRLTSVITFAEARAALAAATRAGRVSAARLRPARTALEDHWDEIARLRVDDTIVRAAGELAGEHALRGYDAVHLASATHAAEGGTILFVTWDASLGVAARSAGLPVAPTG